MINNRYKILKKLGEGRSCVYHCLDSRTNNNYAMKVILPSVQEEEKQKFAEEYRIISRLNHPGIIKAFEYGDILESDHIEIPPGSRYIILELFNGCELSELKNISEAVLKEIIIGIISALNYLHLSNLVYYDLKPENILVSREESIPQIKIIDFGFARPLDKDEKSTRGTAEYIAPELLKNEPYDHRVDYYSLGIMLYKIIYGVFPFDNSSEIKIFRAQLEDEFRFDDNTYSSGINKVMKKLLQKEPRSRYLHAPEIFGDLNYTSSAELLSSWTPAKTFSGRKDILNILNNYIVNYSGGDVFVVRGSEGSGKSALLKEFSEHNDSIVYIDNAKTTYGLDFINNFIEKVLYNKDIFNLPDNELTGRMKSFLGDTPRHIIDEIKGIFSQLVRNCRFILLIDDFNYLDELSLQLFREIIPVLQVNNIKVVLTENSEKATAVNYIHNLHQLDLSPFTDNQVQEMLEKSFYSYYPIEELKKLVLQYADLLPGSIEAFIKDLIIFGIIRFTADGVKVISDENSLKILRQSHEYFYKLRTNSLSRKEHSAAEYLSAFESTPDKQLLPALIKKNTEESGEILINLKTKNILLIQDPGSVSFTSAGMKDFIYSNIMDKRKIHLKIADAIEKSSLINNKELAYQYESAGEYDKSVNFYMNLYNEASQIDAYTYQKKLLDHMITFPVADEKKYSLKFELCKVLLNTGDVPSTLEQCDELLVYNSDPEVLNELLMIKGTALIASGRPEEGIKQIEYLVDILEDEGRKTKLLTEIASAYLDINNYAKCEELCNSIID
ncbi:MAG: hypothetical protein EHM47_16960, partial [Ignavibacteriales bacterium]